MYLPTYRCTYVDVNIFTNYQMYTYVNQLCFVNSLMHPIVPGVPYSVAEIAETGGGAGEESERTLFFSKELSMLLLFCYYFIVYCMYRILFRWYVCNDDYVYLIPSKPDPWLVCVVLHPL